MNIFVNLLSKKKKTHNGRWFREGKNGHSKFILWFLFFFSLWIWTLVLGGIISLPEQYGTCWHFTEKDILRTASPAQSREDFPLLTVHTEWQSVTCHSFVTIYSNAFFFWYIKSVFSLRLIESWSLRDHKKKEKKKKLLPNSNEVKKIRQLKLHLLSAFNIKPPLLTTK